MGTLKPFKFATEVRQEMRKVAWPTRKETMVSTAMVLILVAIAATFFVFVDWAAGSIIRTIIGV
jgi:preprotein translocase subunit SecE